MYHATDHKNRRFHEVASATFSNGKGESFNDAVVVGGVNSRYEGVAAEYQYISGLHGMRGQDWFLVRQTVVKNQDRILDVVEIQLKDPSFRKVFYFDATSFLMND